MTANRYGSTALDEAVAAEVRAEIGRHSDVTVSGIALKLCMRRATLSTRVNGHAPFSPSLLSAVARSLGTTASEITRRAEASVENYAPLLARSA